MQFCPKCGSHRINTGNQCLDCGYYPNSTYTWEARKVDEIKIRTNITVDW